MSKKKEEAKAEAEENMKAEDFMSEAECFVGYPVVYHDPGGADRPAVVSGIVAHGKGCRYSLIVIAAPDNFQVDNATVGSEFDTV